MLWVLLQSRLSLPSFSDRSCVRLVAGFPLLCGPDKRQDFAAEYDHLVKFRPARDDELRHADSFILKKTVCEILIGTQ